MSNGLDEQKLINLVWDDWFSPRDETEFDINKAELAACLARDCYYEDKRHHETFLSLDFNETRLFSNDHLQVILGSRDIHSPQGQFTLFTIVFRGSDEYEDWLHNLDFRLSRLLPSSIPIPNAHRLKVHRGFLKMEKAFERSLAEITFNNGAVSGTLKEILADQKRRSQSLFWINGHSLGGAIATLFAVRLRDYFQVPNNHIQTYTFGAPPIGNRHVARYNWGSRKEAERIKTEKAEAPLQLFRIINTEDPVAGPVFTHAKEEALEGGLLPQPPYKLLGFEHFGREVRFAPRSNPDFYDLYYNLSGSPYSNLHFADVHFMPAYLAGIEVLRKTRSAETKTSSGLLME